MSGSSRARRRARRRRSPLRIVLLGLALLVTAGVVYVGVRPGPDDPTPAAAPSPQVTPSPTPTPLAGLDLSGLPIPRAPFCPRLDRRQVQDALGAPVSHAQAYGSGDRVRLDAGLRDVSHEYGCTYDTADGSQARVWVFAEPVPVAVARSIAGQARREKGCTLLPGAPTYGTPSVATVCRTRTPAARAVTLRGLFGDAWMTCRLSTPGASGTPGSTRRAEQWCVHVATGLGAQA
jgi:hypothetical protein